MLGSQQRKTLFFFLDVIRMVLDEAQSVEQLDELETVALALIERDFPITVQVIHVCTLIIIQIYSGYNSASIAPYCWWYETIWPCLQYMDVSIRAFQFLDVPACT